MKKEVHYAILYDMKRNLKNFNAKDYIQTYAKTDPRILKDIQNYYDENLPMDLNAWLRVNLPDKSLRYANEFSTQISFVRSAIGGIVASITQAPSSIAPMVLSVHYSKSVKLPVYIFSVPEIGLEIVLRNNFYEWKISIKSDIPLDFDFISLFNPSKRIPPIYCQGFPEDKVYGPYSENHSKFTAEISTDYNLYTYMLLLKNYLSKMS